MSEVKIISVEKLEKGTVQAMVEIKGNLFKRLYHPVYGIAWNDEYNTLNDCLAMSKEQERDLEGILQAYVNSQPADAKLKLS